MMKLISYLFRCGHERVTWPVRGWQSCLDCGKRRKVIFAQDSIFASKWEPDIVNRFQGENISQNDQKQRHGLFLEEAR